MSIVHCDYCKKGIDTDFDVAHFIDDDMKVCELQYEKEKEEIELKETEKAFKAGYVKGAADSLLKNYDADREWEKYKKATK